MIDIHTHILPGVDDGAKDWGMCLNMLLQSVASGVDAVIATPHYKPWRKGPEPEKIRMLCKEAEERLWKEHQVELQIYPGNEIYYSTDVMKELREGKVLTLADSRYVLVEFEEHMTYQNMYRAIREFRDGGYIPVLAHIERYQCMQKMEHVKDLKEAGALCQINAEVLGRGIFDLERRIANKCLRMGLVDFIASDMHNLKTRPPMKKSDVQLACDRLQFGVYEDLINENVTSTIN